MKSFTVTVRTLTSVHHYSAIAASSGDACDDALAKYGVASVSAHLEVRHG